MHDAEKDFFQDRRYFGHYRNVNRQISKRERSETARFTVSRVCVYVWYRNYILERKQQLDADEIQVGGEGQKHDAAYVGVHFAR